MDMIEAQRPWMDRIVRATLDVAQNISILLYVMLDVVTLSMI